ncbi:uncharacterized protein LOC135945752 isoform X2 [Cloeon dipterum]|uniref:uncharacterized protein LOC135945752 isoform X2 n=1 Tax=Cloeon dipterum TaxID=197152 RepID=UPI00321FF191
MHLPLLLSVLAVLCAVCSSQKPTTTKKATTTKTPKPTKPPPIDCRLPRDYTLNSNSCFEPKLNSIFGDNGDGSFDAALKECGGNDETVYLLSYFRLNEYVDSKNSLNLNNTALDKKLATQEKILFCIFQALGIVDAKKKFIDDEAGASTAISMNIVKHPYWYSIWKCLHKLCKKLIYIYVSWNIQIVVYIRCYIYYMYMDYIAWPVLSGKPIPEGLTWDNTPTCNKTLSEMYTCNKASPFNKIFPSE